MHNHEHNGDQGSANTIGTIRLAFLLNLVFAIGEFIGGLYINSIAILSDSLHDFGDCISLGLSWYFERLSHRDRNGKYSYGFRRFSLLGAVINAIILIVGSVFIIREAILRLATPVQANVKGMAIFAVIGVIVNGYAAYRMQRGKTMNARVLTWHLLEDVLGWVAVLVISIVMMFVDIPALDPILSMGLSVFVLYNVVKMLVKTISLFLQAVPAEVDLDEIERRIKRLNNVVDVHHTHVWSLDGEENVLTTHIVLAEGSKSTEIRSIKNSIREIAREFHCEHTTVEFEYLKEDCSMPC
ncbi:MAG: cation transporter [Pelolinea sp.]|jgi:cobalt-zinc-cadmium efflux system protein|nr:cation transporter [Pelolinea sp.]